MEQMGQAGKLPAWKRPAWLLWSLATIVLWGAWGLVSKVASSEADVYANQLLYTVGLMPLMIFVAWTVWRHGSCEGARESRSESRRDRRKGGIGRQPGGRRREEAVGPEARRIAGDHAHDDVVAQHRGARHALPR